MEDRSEFAERILDQTANALIFAEIHEQIVIRAVVELQGLVFRSRGLAEETAA